jgi:hypothetical protein
MVGKEGLILSEGTDSARSGQQQGVGPVVFEDQVPESHLIRLLDRLISFDFVRERSKNFCSDPGKIRFVSRRNFGLFLINLGKELPYIVKQETGLF